MSIDEISRNMCASIEGTIRNRVGKPTLQMKGPRDFDINVLFRISILLYYVRELSAQRQEPERRTGNCRQTGVGGSSLPFPPLLRLS